MKNIVVSFKLSNRCNNKGEHPIYMFINWGYYKLTVEGIKCYKPFKYATGLKVLKAQWEGKRGNYRTNGNSDLNESLDNFEFHALDVVEKLTASGNLSHENLKTYLDWIHSANSNAFETNLNGYIEQYLHKIEHGIRLTKRGKNSFSSGSVKTLKTFRNVFHEFQQYMDCVYNFDDIDAHFYDEYKRFLLSEEIFRNNRLIKSKYSVNTAGRHLKHFKMIVRAAYKEGIHNNLFIDSGGFTGMRFDSRQEYLKDEELMSLKNLNLTMDPRLEQIKDMFLIGCYTAQRYCDYSQIKKEDIVGNFITIKQHKTGKDVLIPIKPELRQLFIKHDYTIPEISEQEINQNIKLICKMAGLTQNVEVVTSVGGVETKALEKKYKRISSHTARRSGITNMYRANIPLNYIMRISGHKSEVELLKYIKLSNQEQIFSVESHPYFTEAYSPLRVAR